MPISTLAGNAISNTYQRVVQTDGLYLGDGTGSLINNLALPGNLYVSGTLYANNSVVITESFYSGSNQFGNDQNDIQLLYGTVRIPTGSLTVSGALQISSSVDSYLIGAGRVGIGVTLPQRELHVDGAASLNTDLPLALTSIDTNNRVGILFGSSSLGSGRQHQLYHRVNTAQVDWLLGTTAGQSAIWALQPVDDSSYAMILNTPYSTGGTARISVGTRHAAFALGAGGSGATAITLLSGSNNVGIGTITPSTILNVVKNQNATTQIRVENQTNDTDSRAAISIGTPGDAITIFRHLSNYTAIPTWANKGGIGTDSGLTGGFFFRTAAGPIAFQPQGSTDRVVFATDGTVGIGTSTPSASLHISGASSANLLRIDSPVLSNILFVSGSGNVGIGTSSPAYTLDVSSPIGATTARFFGAGGTATVTIGANGILSSQGGQLRIYSTGANPLTFGSYGTYGDLWVINGNVGVGQGTTAPTLTSRFTIKGSGTTSSTTAFRVENANASSSLVILDNGNVYSNGPGFIASNTAFGFQSLNNPSGSATQNAAFGYQNFTANNYAGYDNVAIGYRAIQNATTGYQNMGIGTETLQNLTTGILNTAVGHSVLRNTTINSGNTGIGFYSLYTLGANQGNSNTGIGGYAFQLMTTGSSNIGIGGGSSTFRSGSFNIFIGAASTPILTGSGNVIIGNNQSLSSSLDNTIAISDGSGNMRIYVSSSGNVGIGTVTPIVKLDVSGSGRFTSGVIVTGSLNVSGSQNYNGDVNINGTLTATVKSFLINHPTQPGKKLQYGNLEGPEHGVYFRGKSTSNIIELPEEWTGLVDEETITVQLTSIGKHQSLYIEEIKNNKVTVGVSGWSISQPQLNYYYLVHGERKDVNKLITTIN